MATRGAESAGRFRLILEMHRRVHALIRRRQRAVIEDRRVAVDRDGIGLQLISALLFSMPGTHGNLAKRDVMWYD